MKNALSQPLPIGEYIAAGSALFDEIHAIVEANAAVVAQLNSGYHSPAGRRALLAQIIGEPVDESVAFNLPLHTDFGRHIRIGKNVFINCRVMFTDLGGITLEDGVLIGPQARILTVNHPENPAERRGLILKPVRIGKNAWIGAGATVLPGVTVGENAIVAAGSVVTKDVPPNTVVGGVPARVLKPIATDEGTCP